jgi:glycosyltransferase involved in cell wall biosynthesis
LKIVHISHADNIGGAAIAALRIHKALCKNGVDSSLWVNKKNTDYSSVTSFRGPIRSHLQESKRLIAGGLVPRVLKTQNKIIHSPQIFSSSWPERINSSDFDVVNLHWVCNEMLSIKDISKIKKPIVWTFHDMWPVCGAEHYTADLRWREGYKRSNRPDGEARWDLNRYVWNKKRKFWKDTGAVVTPSMWLSQISKESVLFKSWSTSTIQHPINTNFWRPINKKVCRELLDLPEHLPLIAIGNEGGSKNLRKGFDLFIKSIEHVKNIGANFGILVFGQTANIPELDRYGNCFYLGHLSDDISLRIAYSAADVFALPSKMDTFSLTAMEAQACNTPVVMFKTSGQQDLIVDADSGCAVPAFNVISFGTALHTILEQRNTLNPRKHILKNNNENKIAVSYIELYRKILNKRKENL